MFEVLKPFIDFFRFSYQHKHVFAKKAASMKRMCYKKELYGAVKVAGGGVSVHKNNTLFLCYKNSKKGLSESGLKKGHITHVLRVFALEKAFASLAKLSMSSL